MGQVEIRPFAAVLGAEVRCGDVRHLGNQSFEPIYQAWLDHLVLLFRDQHLSDRELLDFARRFGELKDASIPGEGQRPRNKDMPELNVLSNVLDEHGVPIGGLGYGEVVWHTDNSYNEKPNKANILYALEIPSTGGNTWFSNQYLACELMDEKLRARVQGLTIKNDASYNSAGKLRGGYSPVTDPRAAPGPSHPVIRTHNETGYNALYLGRRPNAYVNGLALEESEELLNTLWEYATQPRFTWGHEWRVGDILVWDNRCLLHRRDSFDATQRRIIHRTQCKGDPVQEVPGAAAKPPHPRGYGFLAATTADSTASRGAS